MKIDEFWANGHDDYYFGRHTNPECPGTHAHEQWQRGHDTAWRADELRNRALDEQ